MESGIQKQKVQTLDRGIKRAKIETEVETGWDNVRNRIEQTLSYMQNTDFGNRWGLNEAGLKGILLAILAQEGLLQEQIYSEYPFQHDKYADIVVINDNQACIVEVKYIRVQYARRRVGVIPPPLEKSKEYRQWMEQCVEEFRSNPLPHVEREVHCEVEGKMGWYSVSQVQAKAMNQVLG